MLFVNRNDSALTKPHGPKLNRHHPLARGLRRALLLYGDAFEKDFAYAYTTSAPNITAAPSRYGTLGHLNGSTAIWYGVAYPMPANGPFTVASIVRFDTTVNTYQTVFSTLDPANNYRGIELYRQISGGNYNLSAIQASVFPTNANSYQWGPPGQVGGAGPGYSWPYRYMLTYNGGTGSGCLKLYENGILKPTTAETNNLTANSSFDSGLTFFLGGRSNSLNLITGELDCFLYWDRCLTPQEAMQDALDPYGVFRSRGRKYFSVPIQTTPKVYRARPVNKSLRPERRLAKGLKGFWDFLGHPVPRNLVTHAPVTKTGATAFSDGPAGKVLNFNGTTSYVELTREPCLETSSPFTVFGRFRLTSGLPVGGSHSTFIWGSFNSGSPTYYGGLMLNFSNVNGSWVVRLWQANNASGVSTAYSTTKLDQVGKWYSVCGTWDGSYQRIYVDGKLDMTPLACTVAPVANVNTHLTVGTVLVTGTPYYLQSEDIECVAYYDRCLSDSEVNALTRDPYDAFRLPDSSRGTLYYIRQVDLSSHGIAATSVIGTPAGVQPGVIGTGIGSTATIGSAVLDREVDPTGIGSTAAICGRPTIKTPPNES